MVKENVSVKLDFIHFKLCRTQLNVFVLEDDHKSIVSFKDVTKREIQEEWVKAGIGFQK